MNSLEIAAYKNTIIMRMVQNSKFVALVDQNGEFEYPDDLIYERIFPYGKVPDTAQEVGNYITITIDVPSISSKNDLTRNVRVTIRAISHKSLMKVPKLSATRIDAMSAEIDSMFNESYDIGIGYVTLISNKEYTLNESYFYRELIFQTLDLNSKRYGA